MYKCIIRITLEKKFNEMWGNKENWGYLQGDFARYLYTPEFWICSGKSWNVGFFFESIKSKGGGKF